MTTLRILVSTDGGMAVSGLRGHLRVMSRVRSVALKAGRASDTARTTDRGLPVDGS